MISKMVRVGVLWKFRPEEMTEMEQIAEFECTKPRLKVIYEHSNPADPEAMLVMRGRTKVGYINADDKRWLAPLMEKSKRGVMIDFDHVVRHPDGESAVLKYRVTVDETMVPKRHGLSTDWDSWRYPFAQLDTTESMDALDYAFEELLGIIEGADDAAMSLEECVDMLCENCRYDLSCETSERLDACCFALESHGQLALLDRLEAASTHRRGRRGVEEWRTWFEALVHSSRAKRLVQLYKNEVRIRLGVNRVTRQQMSLDLLALEQALFALPGQLFLYIDDPAQLMHMAFYRHITEVKQLELLSALVLREKLKASENPERVTEHSTGCDPCVEMGQSNTPSPVGATECGYGIMPPLQGSNLMKPTENDRVHTLSSTISPLQGCEAMSLWRKLQEAGFVDDNLQPKGNKTEAAIVADEMAECLGIDPRWQPFEELWGTTGLRQKCYKAGGSAKGGVTRENVRKALK